MFFSGISDASNFDGSFGVFSVFRGLGFLLFFVCLVWFDARQSFILRTMNELIYKEESYRIIAACFEVYKEKGCGFLEPVYHECLELELRFHSIPFRAQMLIALAYKGQPLKQRYLADLICFDKILVELKAVAALVDEHRAQVINYLHATGFRLGLLVNFGHHPKLEWERIVV